MAWPDISLRKTDPNFADLRRAIIYGSVLASFNVEAFSLERLRTLTMDEMAERYEMFKAMSSFEDSVRASSGRCAETSRERRSAAPSGA